MDEFAGYESSVVPFEGLPWLHLKSLVSVLRTAFDEVVALGARPPRGPDA